jgi:D-glycero-D-manno-heptose 1,7-bisphosphate phosphatase
MTARRRGALIDRDGTLIDFVRDVELGAVVSAFHPDHVRLLPGVIPGLLALQEAGYALAIATNQPGPAKGQIPEHAVHRTNQALVDMLAAEGIRIEATEVCLHHPEGGPGGEPSFARACDCRKPLPGMLHALVRKLDLDPARSWMIGDAAIDVLAARAAGLRAGLVFALGRCELCPVRNGPSSLGGARPDAVGSTLDELARILLQDPFDRSPG